MKLTDILKILEEVAPVALSDEFCKKYGMYDNSGIIVDCKRILTAQSFRWIFQKMPSDRQKRKGIIL